MKKALIVLDLQKGIVDQGDFSDGIGKIEKIIKDFEGNKDEIIFIKHVDSHDASPLYIEKEHNLQIILDTKSHSVFEKNKPNALSNKNLLKHLKENQIEQLFITGFNTEYCCLFTSITAEHEGYKVTFIEDATCTVNTEETYEMEGLDIHDFVGSVLNWSNCIEVLYYDEFKENY